MAIYKDVEPFEKFKHPNDSEDFVFGVGFVLDKLYDLPVADVVEVKHGEWMPIVMQDNYLEPPYCDTIKCSECGQEADVSLHDAKYCFNCGAKMDGGERNDLEIAECIDRKVSSEICKIITKYFPGWSPKEDMVLKLARKIIEEEKENAGVDL